MAHGPEIQVDPSGGYDTTVMSGLRYIDEADLLTAAQVCAVTLSPSAQVCIRRKAVLLRTLYLNKI